MLRIIMQYVCINIRSYPSMKSNYHENNFIFTKNNDIIQIQNIPGGDTDTWIS